MQNNDNCQDIFIIGAGINGIGIAADAATRGLKVAICDKNDLGAATSSSSSKLIHGGLRYLEQYEFKLVQKALQEREILAKKFPHLISPLKFIMPLTKNHRPAWLIQLGLFIYDHLTFKNSFPRSRKINFDSTSSLLPEFKTGFSYYDCEVDDSRLVITNALIAKQHDALILPRTTFLSAHRHNKHWLIKASNAKGEISEYTSKVLVNASGPWCKQINSLIKPIDQTIEVNLVKGSHIVVEQLYPENNAYILQNFDGRIVFTIPFADQFTLVGTTEINLANDGYQSEISSDEIQYLLNVVNSYFKNTIDAENIKWSFSGIRSLQAQNKANPSAISRDYKFIFNQEDNLITVISGKLTTYRSLAEKIVDELEGCFPTITECKTNISNAKNYQEILSMAKNRYPWLLTTLLQRLIKTHGEAIDILLKHCKSTGDLGKEFAAGLYEVELKYFIEHEWAESAEDILWRRTKLGLLFSPQQENELKQWLQDYKKQ